MPENLKTIRRRVRSVRTTKQITRAMEMVSAAKLRRALQVLNALRPYSRTLQEILAHLSESEQALAHPLFGRGERKEPPLLVVLSSDRGLCGSFNSNLLRAADHWTRARQGQPVELYCIGRKGLDHFRRAKATIIGHLTDLGGKVDQAKATRLADELIQRFLGGRNGSIHVVSARFISNVVNRPAVEKLLPIDPEALLKKPTGEFPAVGRFQIKKSYLLEPSSADVFTALVPKYLRSRILIQLAETFTSEHSARMMAMNNATSNSEELIDTLTLRLNKLRQAAITREIIEVVSGAQAL